MHALVDNSFIISVKKSVVSAKLCKVNTHCPTFADDVSAIALSKEGLQVLLDIMFEYSCNGGFNLARLSAK